MSRRPLSSSDRIVVFRPDTPRDPSLDASLERLGFAPRLVRRWEALDESADGEPPAALIVYLPDGPGHDALELLRRVRRLPTFHDAPVLAVAAPGTAPLEDTFAAGADDCIQAPCAADEMVARLQRAIWLRSDARRLVARERDAAALLQVTQALANAQDFREVLERVVQHVASVVGADRVAVLLIPEGERAEYGYVVANSLDVTPEHPRLDLSHQEAVQQALTSGNPQVVRALDLWPGPRETGDAHVFPIRWRTLPLGLLVVGLDPSTPLSARHLAFCRTVSSATAAALRNAQILQNLRDHTEQEIFARGEAESRLESLVRTKEFLESLIQASVDGIVAADMDGRVILFSTGAERLYGYTAEQVIEQKSFLSLFPPQVGEQVLAMLRSAQHGGPGRLESTRFSARAADGSEVPISLSAAMIFREGEAVATFGIFTDLRERLRVEERLARAQERLELSETQAAIAELAGTAAHELNQPLTSVMGYAELLMRKLPRDTSERRAAEVIVREAERMADIVRKIGRITKYETKSYVGGQKILDLDKASGHEGDGPA